MAPARALLASGAGESLPRLAMALSTTPSGFPSLAARSNSTVSTPALARCAAICAPITPAPRTAARRTSNFSGMFAISLNLNRLTSGRKARCGKTDQFSGSALAVRGLGGAGRALDHPEVGHGVGQRPGQEVQAPVELLLGQVREAAGDGLGELARHVPVLVGQELAQAVVL